MGTMYLLKGQSLIVVAYGASIVSVLHFSRLAERDSRQDDAMRIEEYGDVFRDLPGAQ